MKEINDFLNIDQYKKIDNLVLSIINNEFDGPQYDNKSKKKYFEKNNKQENIKKELTNFISKNFFIEIETFKHFLNLINDMFISAIKLYRDYYKLNESDVIFIYKGGNVFNLHFKKFLIQFPNIVNNELISEYFNFFNKSDCDFSILINPILPKDQFNKIHLDMTNLSFLLLNRIKSILVIFKIHYFDIFKFANSYIQKILFDLKNNINKSIKENYLEEIIFNNISLNYKNLSKINLQKKKDVFIQTDYLDSELSYTYTIINFNNILSKYYNNNNFLFDIELQNLLDFNNLYITSILNTYFCFIKIIKQD